MTLIRHELSLGKQTLFIWTAVIAGLMALCIFIYPDMEQQMQDIGDMFSNMGGFSAAFGMNQLNFGEFMGYFCVECGNILGLGGAFFAALSGISSLSKEEREHTAEFLLTHPISRRRVVAQKYGAMLLQIALFHAAVLAVTFLSVQSIDASPDWSMLALLFLAYFMLQIEIASICFCISACCSVGPGAGLGIAALFYFFNIIANLTESMAGLKYITPFGYAEGADILADRSLHLPYLAVGVLITISSILLALYRYHQKDIS